MTSLTRFALAHKRLVAVSWLAVALVGIALAGKATKAFSDQYSVPGREGYETNAAITRTFGNGGNSAPLVPVVTLPGGVNVNSSSVERELTELTNRLERAVPHVRVASYASTGDRAFVSRDGRTTFLLAYPPPRPGSFGQNRQAVKAARAAVRGLTAAGAPVHLSGLDALDASSGQKGGLGLLAEGLLGGLGALLVLAFVFASLMAFLPLLIALISIMTSFLFVWGLTAVTPVSAIVEFLIALVGLGVAVDYSLLIVSRWREERAHGHDGEQAVVRAMQSAGRAVVFSGTTVAIGLLALVALPVPFLRSVGYAGLLIPLVSVAVATTLLPVILAKLGSRLDWPHLRSDERAGRAWTRWATFVVGHRAAAAAAAVTVLAALMIAATSVHLGAPAGNPNVISERGDARTGLVALERSGIGAGVLSPVEILARDGTATTLANRLRQIPGVQGALAPADGAWHHGSTSLVDVLDHTDSRGTARLVRDTAHDLAPGARVGGIVAQNSDFISAVYGGFPLMLALIAVLTFVLLARAFRSLLLPAKAVLLNVVSVAAAWGVLTLVWQKGYGSHAIWGLPAAGSIPSWLPLIVFAFLYGLSMDYEVFILARMREAYDRSGSTATAVVQGIGRTGRLVTSAALILFLGFVAMATAPSTQVKMIATGLGAGIILDATIVRALLVPAVVSLVGRWNWWLPRPVARVLRAPLPAAAQSGGGEGMSRLLEDKIAIVTGASRGIGAATARAFAAAGATVVLAARSRPELEALAAEITAAGGQALAVPTDVADPVSVEALIERTVSTYGRLDAAFNNAGHTHQPVPLAELVVEEFDRVLAVNARGVFLALKHEIAAMRAGGGGAIVNMTSTAGVRGVQGIAAYVAGKHAIVGLTRTAALDYAKYGIRVNAVAPGPIDSHRLEHLPEQIRAGIAAAVPLGRIGNPDEIADAVTWLASDQASLVTGAIVPIDGGKTAAGA